MRLIVWLVTNTVALAVAASLLPGIRFAGPASGQDELTEKAVPLLVVAVVLGLLTSIAKPALKLLSLPLIILTLGLFLLVINAVLLIVAGRIARELGVGFTVADFWPSAVLGSIVITVVTWVVDRALDRERDRDR